LKKKMKIVPIKIAQFNQRIKYIIIKNQEEL